MIYDISFLVLFLSGIILLLAYLFRQNKSKNDSQTHEIEDLTRENVSQIQKIDGLVHENVSQNKKFEDLERENVSHLKEIDVQKSRNIILYSEKESLMTKNQSLITEVEAFKMSSLMLKSDEETKGIIERWITNGINTEDFSFKSNTSNIEISHGKIFLKFTPKLDIKSPPGQKPKDIIDTFNIEIAKDDINSIIFWKLTSNAPQFETKKSLTEKQHLSELAEYDGFISTSSVSLNPSNYALSKKCPYLGGIFPCAKKAGSDSPFHLSYCCLSTGNLIMNTFFMIHNGKPLYDKMRECQII